MRARGWQHGGGLFISGTATLINTNVYANQAGDVCSPFELALNSHPAPRWNVTCPRFSWQGGGLAVYGMATLTNTNVYSNQADYVCSPFQLSSNFHPSPLWNYVMRIPPPACQPRSRGSQGGGVYVHENGVVNFDDCNINDNTAFDVRSRLELSFHPSPLWSLTSPLAARRAVAS